MPCWHVGPCGIGCDGYNPNPQPMPPQATPIVIIPQGVQVPAPYKTPEEYAELLQSHYSLCCKIAELEAKLKQSDLQIDALKAGESALVAGVRDWKRSYEDAVKKINEWSAKAVEVQGEKAAVQIELKESNRLYSELRDAAWAMVKHMKDRHELSTCCHDVTPTPAYVLERALCCTEQTHPSGEPCMTPLPCKYHTSEKRVVPVCFVCGSEATGKIGAEPRCERHV